MYHQGKSALDRQDYGTAITAFKSALERQSDKALIWQQLGIAYYRTDQFLNAANSFKQAALLDSEDDVSILYLGLSYEVLGKEDEALQVYRSYLSTRPESRLTNRIRRRVRYLSDSILRDEVRSFIAGEDSIDIDRIPGNTISVLGFKTEKIDPQYAALGRGLAQMLMTDLAKVSALRVIERMKLNEIARELELSSSDLADKQYAPRLGKLLGAATLVTGDLVQPEPEELSAEAGVIRTAEGIATYPEGASGKLDQFFVIEKELLYNILDELGHTPTEAERVRLDSIQTSSFLSFLAYSRGLTYSDEGMYRLAEAEFSAALAEDPDFSAAARARDRARSSQAANLKRMFTKWRIPKGRSPRAGTASQSRGAYLASSRKSHSRRRATTHSCFRE
jgi:tetratricopeptide (TPR) repeat protein